MLTSRPAMASSARWLSQDGKPLLWSRRGHVACEQHAPNAMSERWVEDGWTWIPVFAGKNKIEYCCQECAGGPIRHHRITASADVTASASRAAESQRARVG
jgi:hypothetical protein